MSYGQVQQAVSLTMALGEVLLRDQVIPVLRDLREKWNALANDLDTNGGLVMGPGFLIATGNGVPVATPATTRALYIRLDGGAGTTLYVWEGAAWAPK